MYGGYPHRVVVAWFIEDEVWIDCPCTVVTKPSRVQVKPSTSPRNSIDTPSWSAL